MQNKQSNLIQIVRSYINSFIKHHQGLKAIVVDSFTMGIFSVVMSQTQILGDHVCITELISNLPAGRIDFLAGIYFVRANQQNITEITKDLRSKKPRFKEYYLYFSNQINDQDLRRLAQADVKGVIASVVELYNDYIPISRNLFSLDIPSTLSLNKKIQRWTMADQQLSKRIIDGVYSYLVSNECLPVFRYQKNSEVSYRIIDRIRQRIMQDDDQILLKHSGSCTNPKVVMLILDRRDDPVTPLLNQFTYQAMLHELIGIKRNRIKLTRGGGLGDSQYIVSQQVDSFYATNIYSFLSDVAGNVKQITDKYKADVNIKRNIESLQKMQEALDSYPQFAKQANLVKKHVDLMSDMNRKIKTRGLNKISKLQQQIVTVQSRNSQFTQIRQFIEDPMTNNFEKLRLVLLYAIRYEQDPNISILKVALEKSGMTRKQIDLIDSVLRYAGKAQRGIDLFKTGLFAKAKGVLKQVFKDVQNVYTQHQSLMSGVIDQILKGRLKQTEFPAITFENAHYNPKDKPNRLIIFYMGGTTYQQAREIDGFNNLDTCRIQLGGTFIHNSKTFLAEVSQLGDMDDFRSASSASSYSKGECMS